MTFAATVLTLYPEAFPGPLGVSLIGKALAEKRWSLDTVQIRDFGDGPRRKVDDAPAGGGAGLVMRPDVAAAAIDSVPRNDRPLLFPSPRGKPFTQAMAREWSHGSGLVIFCGRFEGLDERVIEARQMIEVCVGDAVLMGGEVAAQLILEATVRLLPGVLGNELSATEESFEDGLLEHPQFTKPRVWEGRDTPEVLLSGDHAKVEAWRKAERRRITRARRPDLLGD
ncbi:MAG: tRNA (guanosine(37)-N1)-methyltransferase TrmD [Hyphomonadaceae bacterium]|nr:MAG: tRNA (guanine37-N1)-methyltransferase [Caulobacteraceae bacterium]MBT9446171.1 tRNA (guanosine(37)-N1)-methyltransferase TrmD [Hyphomonadaceae bacterium]TPW07142.1 MAG: tRNA (guanine37-N1)-methyltransferase [Alphaproteobacteria bacterium]